MTGADARARLLQIFREYRRQLSPYVFRTLRYPRTFTWNGIRLRYFNPRTDCGLKIERSVEIHALKTERSVEVPIAQHVLRQFHGQRVLEVGNVLAHYQPVTHTVVDKYELASEVINADVVDYVPMGGLFDLILSVSTLEHVGWDELPRDPEKVRRAIQHLRDYCLKPQGLMLITLPVGYNPHADSVMFGSEVPAEKWFLKRVSRLNMWRECTKDEARACEYGRPYPCANAVCVGLIRGPEQPLP